VQGRPEKGMLGKVTMRFQHWVLALTLLLVVSLSSVFLLTVFQTFKSVAEDRALGNFSLIADQTWLRLDTLLQGSSRFVTAQAHGAASQFVDPDGRLNGREMVSTFIASIDAEAGIYSHFFALANEDFLQIIGIRGDVRLIKALQAPAGAYFAVRRISHSTGGGRSEEWLFLDQRRQALARRQVVPTFFPRQRPWYGQAMQADGLALTDPYLFASNGELGITVATPLPDRLGVLATDISLNSLQGLLESLPLPPNGMVTIADGKGRILAFHGKGGRYAEAGIVPLSAAEQIRNPYLSPLLQPAMAGGAQLLRLGPDGGEKFVVARHQSQQVGGTAFTVIVSAPLSDFLGPFKEAERCHADVRACPAGPPAARLPWFAPGRQRPPGHGGGFRAPQASRLFAAAAAAGQHPLRDQRPGRGAVRHAGGHPASHRRPRQGPEEAGQPGREWYQADP